MHKRKKPTKFSDFVITAQIFSIAKIQSFKIKKLISGVNKTTFLLSFHCEP